MSPSRSHIFAPTSSQIERAWHLVTVLIRLGRPASPSELASRSATDSILLSPDLVEFLCRIPGSPISLTSDRYVTISELTFTALDRFLDRTFRLFVPRGLFSGSEQTRDWSSLRLMYARKRKKSHLDAGPLDLSAKRRLFWSEEGDAVEARIDGELGIQSTTKALKVHVNVAGTLADSLSAGASSKILRPGVDLTPSIPNAKSLLPSFKIKTDDHLSRYDGIQKMCSNADKMTLGPEFHADSQTIVFPSCEITQDDIFLELFGCDDSLDFLNNNIISDDIVGRSTMNKPAIESSLLDEPNNDMRELWMETLGEDSCIVPAAPLAVRYDVNPPRLFLGAENDSTVPSINIGDFTGKIERHSTNEVAAEVNYGETKCIPFQTDASTRGQDISALKVQSDPKLDFLAASLSAEPGTYMEHQRTSAKQPKITDGIASIVGVQRSVQEPNAMTGNTPKCEQDKRNEKGTLSKRKMKGNHIVNVGLKENRQEAASKIPTINSESKLLPNFDSFVIEEEEGSGGYGTVYRARRKDDGKIFAVKCPHPNAHSHHINNELRMLERFGGRNFVIKYEGSFKSGQSECFVLEHVEHDRPEVLKKEIDVFELQWYGFCMFRALASLHKQGIVHRDIKPGNFLFSRKLNKGYLIDFNLASDLHQKFSKNNRSGSNSIANSDPVSLSSTKSNLYSQAGNAKKDRGLDSIAKEATHDSRKSLLKSMKRPSKGQIETFPNIKSSNKYGSQAADSGVTSAKDPTSTRIHSADRLKQPIPCKGRKELINFVQEAMQSPSNKEETGPTSHRKRVAAPSGKPNSRLMILTPMPLHSGGNAVAGAGMLSRGNAKNKKEGPCVGTKGFRAPEVLLKSCYQGCKVDVWSAGVTLLYLIIGKAPFGGDPEQNIKEIAKLRGSEDLWEVAKLHNCEPSYPADLLDVRFLRTAELRDWCATNTKRPEFLELVPQSLFDLLNKCLTVNPRRRITAEEAIMHGFFTPCHESLKKQRMLRRAAGSEPGSSQTL